jgi:hypothetical protein
MTAIQFEYPVHKSSYNGQSRRGVSSAHLVTATLAHIAVVRWFLIRAGGQLGLEHHAERRRGLAHALHPLDLLWH